MTVLSERELQAVMLDLYLTMRIPHIHYKMMYLSDEWGEIRMRQTLKMDPSSPL